MDRYRTLTRRIVALLIDGLVFTPIIAINALTAQYELPWWMTIVQRVLFALIGVGYYVLLHWKYGQTVGKMVMRLKVVSLDERPISLRQSLIRHIFYIIERFVALCLLVYFVSIGYSLSSELRTTIQLYLSIPIYIWIITDTLVCIVNKQDRALHDLIAGTVVVRLDVPETPSDESKLEPPGPEHYEAFRNS